MRQSIHQQFHHTRICSMSLLAAVFVCTAFASFMLVSPQVALAQGAISTDDGRIARGGRLYDKWFAVTGAEKPADTHAAWPSSNTKKKGDVTWRCKSCHGWDNMGKDGAYASGSYKTGIKGVRGLAGADQAKIVAVIKDDNHGVADLMDDQDFADLALFISVGMSDMDKYIDRASKAPKGGDKAKGQAYYETVCLKCHGATGTQIKDMDPLGKVMGSNPWEVLHKIRYGQPKERMPALYAFDPQVAVDIMAYIVDFPKEK